MQYSIHYAPAASKWLRKSDPKIQKRLVKRIERLGKNPRPKGVKQLSGKNSLYRVREGDYRIIYKIEDGILKILVVKIRHRKEVYKKL